MAITRITKKTLKETIREQHLPEFVDQADVDRTPGIFGIARTKAGNYMVYQVNDQRKLYHTSVHANKREANGRLLERLVAAQA